MRDLLDGFERERFPVELCVRESTVEPGIFESNVPHLCLVVDIRFPFEAHLRTLYPYTCLSLEDPGLLLFGWSSTNGDYVDHVVRSVHCDTQRVVAWRVLDAPLKFISAAAWPDEEQEEPGGES